MKSQAVMADQEMHGARHQLHHFVDLREFPVHAELKAKVHIELWVL